MRTTIAILLLLLFKLPVGLAQELKIDPTFGSSGTLTFAPGTSKLFFIDNQQRLIHGGISSGNGISIFRHDTTGMADLSFANMGVFETSFSFQVNHMFGVQLTGGKYVFVGANYTQTFAPAKTGIVLLDPNGNPDNTFAGSGKLEISMFYEHRFQQIVQLPNGNLLLHGMYRRNFGFSGTWAIIHIVIDQLGNFVDVGGNGGITNFSTSIQETAGRVFLQDDGKLLMITSLYNTTLSQRQITLTRLNTPEDIDPTFGVNGVMGLNYFSNDDYMVTDIARRGNNILISGSQYIAGIQRPLLLECDLNGALTSFFYNQSSVFSFYPSPGAEYIADLQVLPENDILVSGNSGGIWFLARLRADGSLNTDFGIAGTSNPGFFESPVLGQATDVVVGENGDLFLAGTASTHLVAMRLVTPQGIRGISYPQYLAVPTMPTLSCAARKISLTNFVTSHNNTQSYVIQSGNAQIFNDTLTITGPGEVVVKMSTSRTGMYGANDSTWRIAVALEIFQCDPQIYTFVSADQDGLNDYFEINTLADQRYTLEIFDRWGQRVYYSSQYDNSWNGWGLPPGNYQYRLVFSNPADLIKTGYIKLLK